MIYDLTPDQIQLENLMSDISEKCYSAGWETNLEFVLWDAVINGERKYGHDIITIDDIDLLKKLSTACSSWIHFDDQTEETAIDLDKWRQMFYKAINDNPSLVKG